MMQSPLYKSRFIQPSWRVYFEEMVRHRTGDTVNVLWAAINRQGQARALDNTRLAHHQELLSGKSGIINLQQTRLMLVGKPFCETAQRAGEAIMPERISQMGELICLRDNNAIQPDSLVVDQQCNNGRCGLDEGGTQIRLGGAGYRFERIKPCAAAFFKKGSEQIGFILKMIIERAFRDPRQLCNLGHGGPLISLLEEKLPCTGEDLLTFTGGIFPLVWDKAVLDWTGLRGRFGRLCHYFRGGLFLLIRGHDKPRGGRGPYRSLISSLFFSDDYAGAAL